jgi:hypothetical protein
MHNQHVPGENAAACHFLIGAVAGGGKSALTGGALGAGAGTAGAAMTGNNRDMEYPAESVLAFRLSKNLNLSQAAGNQ